MVDIQVPRDVRIPAERLPAAAFAFFVAAYRVQRACCFYLWITAVHASRYARLRSPDRVRDAASPKIPRRRRINLIDPAQAISDAVAIMNGSSEDSSDDSRSSGKGRRSEYAFRTGKADRFAWEQALMPKLQAKYTDAPGDGPVNGASALKRKAAVLPYVKGLRASKAQEMYEKREIEGGV